jgi:FkbM family methyltransferase
MKRKVYVLLARTGVLWIRGFAFYQARVKNRPHQLAGAERVTKGLYRLTFADGSVFHIASPQRINRYLKPAGLTATLDALAGKYLDPGWDPAALKTVVDVGANVGEFATALLSANPDLHVLCVEADPAALPALRANLSPFPSATVAPVAVGDRSGEMTFYSSWRDADSSLIKPSGRSRALHVRVTTLDDVVRGQGWTSVSLVKMDAEGAEPEVLAGAPETLAATTAVAIDAGLERAGEDTITPVTAALESIGFTVRVDGPMARATRKPAT